MLEEKSEPSGNPGVQNNFFPLAIFTHQQEKNFFFKNGLSNYEKRLRVRVISQIDQCSFIWNYFSGNESLFNLWEFRYAWYQGYQYLPYFYTIYEGKKLLACLPLWYNRKEKRFEWFGGCWPEDNYFFVGDEKFIPLLLKIAPQPLVLNAIIPNRLPHHQTFLNFQEDSPKYVLLTKEKKTIDDILLTLEKKHRHHLRYFFKKFSQLNPKIEILLGDQSRQLPLLKELSFIDFERKDISAYREKERIKTFEEIYKNQGRYQILTFLIYIQNYLVGYDITVFYKKTFYLLTGASDLARFPGISVFITYLEIMKGLTMGANLIDCMQEDNNWKHKYFKPQKLLKFKKAP